MKINMAVNITAEMRVVEVKKLLATTAYSVILFWGGV
jgi:hypothetical protein